MSKYNTRGARPIQGTSPLTTEQTSSGVTHQGGAGYAYDEKTELFLLAVSGFAGEDKFHESARAGDSRFVTLVRSLTRQDPDWVAEFLRWLRTDANMRTAAIVGAAQYAVARRTLGPTVAWTVAPKYTVRQVVASVLQRLDEPGEFIAYWRANVQRSLPGGVQRGVADAVIRLSTEFSYLKYDSEKRGYRFADVLNLVHPGDRRGSAQRLRGPWQHELFNYATARPYRDVPVPGALDMLTRREALGQLPVSERRRFLEEPELLQRAGVTWESLAGWLQGPMDKQAWEAVIPLMGYMALLRNLRNFDEAGVGDSTAEWVASVLRDPQQVARSRQLPMRFLSAYRAAPSLRWAYPLEQALDHSLGNVPELRGSTLIMVDTSSSMNAPFSKDGTLMRWDAAVVFALALARRCERPTVVSFSSNQRYHGDPAGARTKEFVVRPGESLLKATDRWKEGGWFLGGGTDTALALRQHYAGHDRVVVLTDEQAARDYTDVHSSVPERTPLYTWNLAGYERGHAPAGTPWRHTFGGLTDAAFKMIPLIEAGQTAAWPWQLSDDLRDCMVRSTVPDGYNDYF